MRRSISSRFATAGALFALACGGGEPAPRPSAQAMVPEAAAEESDSSAPSTRGGSGVPVISRVALSPAVPVPGTEMRAVVEASDPDGDSLRFHYVWTHNGREVGSGTKSVLYLVDLAKGDRVEVVVVASDGANESEPVSAKAATGNRPPVLSAVTLEPFGDVRAGEVITATPHASDPDNDQLQFTYAWTVNGDARGRDRTFDTKGLHRGDKLQVRVVASDGRDDSREESSPVLMLGNSPPMITQLPSEQFDDGAFRYTFAAKDPDGDRNLRFFVEKGPEGMRMDPITGVLTWTPSSNQAGVHPVEVSVKDGKGEGSAFSFELTVRATPPPAPAARR